MIALVVAIRCKKYRWASQHQKKLEQNARHTSREIYILNIF